MKGHKEETILTWLREAAQHAAQVEEVLMADFHVKRGQLDALWAYVQNKGEKGYIETETSGQFWRSTYLDMDSRLRVARGIAKDETQASIEVFRTLQRRGHPNAPPPTISDGWGEIGQAILEVYRVVPEYQGRGRPPTRKKPGRHWQYVQAIRQKDEQGRCVGVRSQVVFGSRREALELLGRSTVYVERSHLTSRLFNGRQVRKTLAFSKALGMYRAAAIWEDAYYNLVRPYKSLCIPAPEGSGQRWQPRRPAMAAGLTDHI